ncbi:carbohydrate sulfotransferase 1-like [Mercenaria mercenaria]|uniref:carbohydrate sulfotransferase 1-like n=1 Tax=Mercenaria mercenaria TaxID=6596 RepID=UPI00234F9CB5|nr:carbohydrate sulfotransferase 1-like [Mercenaria mercenaria]
MNNIACFKVVIICSACWVLLVILLTLFTDNSVKTVFSVGLYNSSVSTAFEKKAMSVNSTLPDRTDVLLVAYMRTGSTFLGKVLGWRDDVFFWFEPLRKDRNWQYLRGNDLLCQDLKPACEITASNQQKIALRFLLDIFDCNLQPYDSMPTDINFKTELLPPSWFEYAKCKKSLNKSLTCNTALTNSCKKTKHRIAKVLRIDLEGTASLLERNPRLKIVQLLRDPRAIMNSHLRTGWYGMNLKSHQQIEADSIVLCSRLRNDILAGKSLMKLYPDRVRLLQYEDFKNLDEKVQKLYKFLNMELISQQNNILQSLKEDNSLHAKMSSTNVKYERHDGFHPFLFREQMDWVIAETVHKHCGDVLRELGLRQFKTEEEYRDLTQNVVIDKLPFELM